MGKEHSIDLPRRISKEERASELFPQHLRSFVPWNGELEDEKLPLSETAFTPEGEIIPEFKRLLQLKDSIACENDKRVEKGQPPVNLVGIHASSDQDIPSKALLEQLLLTPERLGIKTKIFTVDDKNGRISFRKIEEIKKAVQNADGIIITTHTKGGSLNSRYMSVQEALDEIDLKGKVFYFSHTFDNPETDSQLRPEYNASQFFQRKGCLSIPYPLYVHTGGLNETWVTRDVERSGINLIRILQRLANSQLKEFVQNPELAEKKGKSDELTQTWKSLRRKVEKINKEREEKGEGPLTALFVLAGENPEGYSAALAKELALNFKYLGVKTDWFNIARSKIAPSEGDPNVTLAQEIPNEDWQIRPGSMEEAYVKMLEADMIIFTTPVRLFEAANTMQKFVERTVALANQGFLLEGKVFCTLITYGEAGASDVQARLDRCGRDHGMINPPYGGVSLRLGAEPSKSAKDMIRSKKAQIRRMAVFATAMVTDILIADGKKASKMRFDHLNPLLSLVSAED